MVKFLLSIEGGFKIQETLFYAAFKAYFDILNRLGVTHECDGRTDIVVANAALNYVARPKTNYENEFMQTWTTVNIAIYM